MKVKVTTESGSVYEVDTTEGVWNKNREEHYTILTSLKSGEWDGTRGGATAVHAWPEVDAPVVGENMYIHGHGFYDWWLTTKVISVEKVEEWDD